MDMRGWTMRSNGAWQLQQHLHRKQLHELQVAQTRKYSEENAFTTELAVDHGSKRYRAHQRGSVSVLRRGWFLFFVASILCFWSLAASVGLYLLFRSSRTTTFLASARTRMERTYDGDANSRLANAGMLTSSPIPAQSETSQAKRRERIKLAFAHAWKGYESFAWGKDTLKPLSKSGEDDFLGMAITLIDAMDTAWIMGLHDEFQNARDYVVARVRFESQEDINVFETTIRVLGGMLSVYGLTGDASLLDACVRLADRLLPAFDTKTGLPYGTMGLSSGKRFNPTWAKGSTIAEVGTVQLEFRYLSHVTGEPKYKDVVDRAWHWLEHAMLSTQDLRNHGSNQVIDGLFPMFVDPETGTFAGDTITLGARGDSLYEYFLKGWIQTERKEQWLKDMYDMSVEGIRKHLLKRTSGPRKLLYIAEMKADSRKTIPKMDHLVCFAPGMIALGVFMSNDTDSSDAKEILDIARDLMYTCYQMYALMPTGLAPEIAHLDQHGTDLAAKSGAMHNLLRPETVESLFVMWRVTKEEMYREWGWEIFERFEKYTKVESGGYASLENVEEVPPRQRDKMESFFLAETLKYFYLLYSDDQVIPLDKYVFNTEAHPLPIFANS